ncbi:MAG: hypothetical protein KDC87_08745 [Planctomycetes bacterium]|nr:hypothetical protein [Planctomycetota bacterium]MCB9868741.1 hypothetical protein [Planctomycetota bacterium]MCB9888753.1 hypothetical protein [Planctomycetota bacterium]
MSSAHEHSAAETVTITDGQLLPAAEVSLPTFGTVVFRNARSEAVTIEVDRPLGVCSQCSTALGFVADGAQTVAKAIPAHGIASLCFHDAGRFGFVVRGAAGEQRGSIAVGGSR